MVRHNPQDVDQGHPHRRRRHEQVALELWILLSDAAWVQGIFPSSFYFVDTTAKLCGGILGLVGERKVLIPDVDNLDIRFLLHEHVSQPERK